MRILTDTTSGRLEAETRGAVQVLAFYAHGDVAGRIMTQDQTPCWTDNRVPVLSGAAIVAHACRALVWFESQAKALCTRAIFGYREDLVTPAEGSESFWNYYTEIHSLLPALLATGINPTDAYGQFYDMCTIAFRDLNGANTGLIELIAIQQSRDKIECIP